MNRGSISVFLAMLLSVTIIFSLVCLEHVRIFGIKTRLEAAGESAMDSLFAAYDGDVFDRYGILVLNLSDLPGERTAEEDVRFHLEKEMNPKNGHLLFSGNMFRADVFSVLLEEPWAITEKGGSFFVRSVCDYMKYSMIGIGLETLLEQVNITENGEEERAEAEKARLEQEENIYTVNEEEQEGTSYGEVTAGSFLDTIERVRENGWLDLIVPIDKVASSYSTDKAGFPSESYLAYARFFEPLGGSGPAEKLLFTEYLLENFSCFTSGEKVSGMQYQLEYILCGKKSDRKNLEGTVARLLLIREGLDFTSLMASQNMRRQTEMAAAAIAGWTGIAPIIWMVQGAVAAAWAFCEAIVDVRTLLGGGKIPLLKNETEWVMTPENIPSLLDGNTWLSCGKEEGIDYIGHMRIALFLEDLQTGAYRTMDVIQDNIGKVKPGFMLENCLYAATVRVLVRAEPLFASPRKSRYDLAMNFSRMY